jgi:DNA-binding transcriptional LysR family regulator
MAVHVALDGLGIAHTIESLAEPFLRSGQLVRVLEEWLPLAEGYLLYYADIGRNRWRCSTHRH